jgi:hypothetical protein
MRETPERARQHARKGVAGEERTGIGEISEREGAIGATPLKRKPRISCRAFLAGLLSDVLFALARAKEPGFSPLPFCLRAQSARTGVSVSLRFFLAYKIF